MESMKMATTNKKIFDSVLRTLANSLNSWISAVLVFLFIGYSLYLGRVRHDMNLFAASGAIATVFGLLLMIQFTTIEKYLQQETIVAQSTGMTGPPMSQENAEAYAKKHMHATRIRIKRELRSELMGLFFTISGTLIWAYGSYI
jgi:uncharacterized membrane protein